MSSIKKSCEKNTTGITQMYRLIFNNFLLINNKL
uniref:Uncharacterized protein n=1 Tax=viral metagenome TaxID=1070528 RepID=A0A6C0FAS2_9ZZZZ